MKDLVRVEWEVHNSRSQTSFWGNYQSDGRDACFVAVPSIASPEPPTNTILLSAIFFSLHLLHRALATTSSTVASSPNFLMNAVTGTNEVWPQQHSKLKWLLVIDANRVMFLLCSIDLGIYKMYFYLFTPV